MVNIVLSIVNKYINRIIIILYFGPEDIVWVGLLLYLSVAAGR